MKQPTRGKPGNHSFAIRCNDSSHYSIAAAVIDSWASCTPLPASFSHQDAATGSSHALGNPGLSLLNYCRAFRGGGVSPTVMRSFPLESQIMSRFWSSVVHYPVAIRARRAAQD